MTELRSYVIVAACDVCDRRISNPIDKGPGCLEL